MYRNINPEICIEVMNSMWPIQYMNQKNLSNVVQ